MGGTRAGERKPQQSLILFGLTTAFLFAAIQQVWLLWRD
jgi:hypothetical protein